MRVLSLIGAVLVMVGTAAAQPAMTDQQACDAYLQWCSDFAANGVAIRDLKRQVDAMSPAERREKASAFGKQAEAMLARNNDLQKKVTGGESLVPASCADTCKKKLLDAMNK